jgi:hypothetical protein
MSTDLSSVDLSDSPEEPEATPPTPRRSRWVGLLVLVAIVLLCGIGVILFERQSLTQRVANLEALLEESRNETGAVAAQLSRETTRVEDLRSTMGEINEVSAELVQKLTSLRVLTSDAMANSSSTGEVAAEVPEAPIVEEVEEVEAVDESVLDDAGESNDAAFDESALDRAEPDPSGRLGAPAIGVMRPISPDFM